MTTRVCRVCGDDTGLVGSRCRDCIARAANRSVPRRRTKATPAASLETWLVDRGGPMPTAILDRLAVDVAEVAGGLDVAEISVGALTDILAKRWPWSDWRPGQPIPAHILGQLLGRLGLDPIRGRDGARHAVANLRTAKAPHSDGRP